jgi:hypothetical protein
MSFLTLSSIASAADCGKPGPGMTVSSGGVFTTHFDLKDSSGKLIARAQEVFNLSTYIFEFTDCNGVKLGSIKEQMTDSFTNPYGTYQFLDAAGREIASSKRTATKKGTPPSHELVVSDKAGTPLASINGKKVNLLSNGGAVDTRVFTLLPTIVTMRDHMIDLEDKEMDRQYQGLSGSNNIPNTTSKTVVSDVGQPKAVQAKSAPQTPKTDTIAEQPAQ